MEDSLREAMPLDAIHAQIIAPRYRTTNWSSYNASLRKRGSLLIWLGKNMT